MARAIDLYSGVGGWSLGLTMAGVKVVASYEWWGPANATNAANNRHATVETDIRTMPLRSLPRNIDFVVGSPPCTQFSYSNRGGGGDIDDGLKDIVKFLEVVDYLQPSHWLMENVPRVAEILRGHLKRGGQLARFAHLRPNIEVFDMVDFGLPQKRRRCIAGNVDFQILSKYSSECTRLTLGDIVTALKGEKVIDPIYGVALPKSNLTDHDLEPFLSSEEERMNRESKTHHPVYNNMRFPDPLGRPVRTITATCTRVSRESVVIRAPGGKNRFRRLSVRERACLQGFPITFQFYGKSHAQKLRMVGNAMPPLFAFRLIQAALKIAPGRLTSPETAISAFKPPTTIPRQTIPDKPGRKFPPDRRFRAAIPGLRLKSGVRFELANQVTRFGVDWRISFYFGSSKQIASVPLDGKTLRLAVRALDMLASREGVAKELESTAEFASRLSSEQLQAVWTRLENKAVHPYEVVDFLGEKSKVVTCLLENHVDQVPEFIKRILEARLRKPFNRTVGTGKLQRLATCVFAGLLVGSTFNVNFSRSAGRALAA